MDGGAWWAVVHEVAKGRTGLSDFTFTFHFHALEKETATHSSILAWRMPGTGEPGGLPSMGSHRVGHNWSDLAAAAGSHLNVVRKGTQKNIHNDHIQSRLSLSEESQEIHGNKQSGSRSWGQSHSWTPAGGLNLQIYVIWFTSFLTSSVQHIKLYHFNNYTFI